MLQQWMNGRTPRARYGLVLLFMKASETGRREYSRLGRSGGGAIPPCQAFALYFDMQEDRTMWGQKHAGENRSMLGSDSGNGAFLNTQHATVAIEKLRSGIDQA